MSPSAEGSGPAGSALPGFDVLEEAIARTVRQLDVWRRRAFAADADRRQLRALLEEVQAGDGDPTVLARELTRLRDENRALRDRLTEARTRAERIEKHLLFLEDARR